MRPSVRLSGPASFIAVAAIATVAVWSLPFPWPPALLSRFGLQSAGKSASGAERQDSNLTSWRIVGEKTDTCNCAWGCPCQFNARPTHGRCEALVAVRIHRGHYGATTLDGVTFAAAYWWPGAVHEGNGIRQLAIDERATADQRTALVNITSGKEGCPFFEIFASVVTSTLDPIYVPIDLSSDRTARVASLKVPGLGEFRVEPIRNPVTGEEHRALIRLPNGFEYKEAEMANCLELYARAGDKVISNTNSYAQFAAIEWSNA